MAILADEPSAWKKHTINHRSPFEAVGVADINRDGKPDVFCGDSWYAAPDWTRHKVRDVLPGTNPQYHEDFADAPLDVNGDGKIDIVTCAYFSRTIGWVEQPDDPTQPWTEHTIDIPGSMETAYLLDLYGDKTPVLIPNVGGQVLLYELASNTQEVAWTTRRLSPQGAGHGVGHGDINGDGRIDLLTPLGWYEQPAERSEEWAFHPEFSLGNASIEIIGHDFDGDGDTDVVWGMGHDFGLHWMKQSTDAEGNRVWTKEDIDTSFSQVHTLHLADFDGDGQKEFVTGKRIYAHASEPGATAEPCLFIYRYDPQASAWIRSVVYRGEPALSAPLNPEQRDALKDFRPGSAGTGLQMALHDIDADGDIDIVAPGKSGLYWFENPLNSPRP
ncbi:MAG: VCBS repeat-containing protein [Planctomycetota bacterium]|nr:MAG: VCBS repeat-containing protein [Planctomycetota bacterium]